MVRMQFRCSEITPTINGIILTLDPLPEGANEPRDFFAYFFASPIRWGKIEICIGDAYAVHQFTVGQACCVDLYPAEADPAKNSGGD